MMIRALELFVLIAVGAFVAIALPLEMFVLFVVIALLLIHVPSLWRATRRSGRRQ